MITKIISKILRQTADDLDLNKYQCSEEELLKILDTLTSFNQSRELSKEEAQEAYLKEKKEYLDYLVQLYRLSLDKETQLLLKEYTFV